jgi:aspartate aminotransferase-like enzyme
MVFYQHDAVPQSDSLPRYIDLGYYASQQGVPFTFSSNLLHALHAAVKRIDWDKRFAEIAELSTWLREQLIEMGFQLIGTQTRTAAAVVTIALPPEMDSVKIGALMQETGYLLSCNSDYLKRKNWIQICLMGECQREKVVSLLNALNRVCFKRKPTDAAKVK